jgi:hypothetical protein
MFATFTIFSIIMLVGINISDKKALIIQAKLKYTLLTSLLGTLTYTILLFGHQYLAGIKVH